ncbi:MAG: leucyl/phenylalanyl-tRNA--protein transferase [Moraxella sp.]|jgi:leucyl/phenylalanyl-tRNA--protein transferase|nr:leucyl/phenylalanyl-tRNA--protein transferase [Moraxella osloensis]MBP6341903.1 leucyl/phenylalanyl-tRNA--protein transferase [Moraxella sp.]MBP6484679.1 leucyl/phenylalanyl-tRNA--protein transferase [Moraxella sp.]MBP7233595.1 leucyl/phenylalanyl-tRNA--protein transferase [Moraxella sp.]
MPLPSHHPLQRPFGCRYQFPDPMAADPDGEGLIALGGDLAADTLVCAYRQGMFPWFNEGEPIAWWSPDPRCIIYPSDFCASKTLKRRIKNAGWTFSLNLAFAEVIAACADTRTYAEASGSATWISPAMIEAYTALHAEQVAYSVEIWDDDELIGGLYGLKLGQAFFGESMFHRVTDASKAAFFVLMQLCAHSQFAWVDCQLPNPHLLRLGASIVPRAEFLAGLAQQLSLPSIDWSSICGQKLPLNQLLNEDFMTYYLPPSAQI